ncbi:MAG TPA: SNF2-related protein [bacterium]|nr:SNF2-related protein [bacterium]HPN42826.1 SNF2-related protein [bacterium]
MSYRFKKYLRNSQAASNKRGESLYRRKRVTLLKTDRHGFIAQVKDGLTFTVHAETNNDELLASCSCESWSKCEHIVAAHLAWENWLNTNKDNDNQPKHPEWKSFFSKILEQTDNSILRQQKGSQQWKLVYILKFAHNCWFLSVQKAYIKKDGILGRVTNIGAFDPQSKEMLFSENDPVIISYLQKREESHNSFFSYDFFSISYDNAQNSSSLEYGAQLGPLLELMRESKLFISSENNTIEPVTYSDQECHIEFSFTEDNDNYTLSPWFVCNGTRQIFNSEFHVLSEQPVWVFKGHTLYKLKNPKIAGLLLPFSKEEIVLHIPKKKFPEFLEKNYSQLSPFGSIPLPDSFPVQKTSTYNGKILNFKENTDYLEMALQFDYKCHIIDYTDQRNNIFKKNKAEVLLINRDLQGENETWNDLAASGLRITPRGSLRIGHANAQKWLFANLPAFKDKGFQISGLDKPGKYKIRTGEPTVKIAVTTKIDWFDLNLEIDIEGVKLSLKELRASLRQNKRIVRLEDKSIAQLSEEWFKKFKHLFNFSEIQDDHIKVARHHITLIDLLFEEVTNKNLDAAFQENLQRLTNFKGIDHIALPQNMQGILREYQVAGHDWLHFLKEYSFGGCLADDMGLGKTLQTLTLLLREKQAGNTIPSLIVCPTSVVFNWEKEVQKFTPQLKTLLHTGNVRSRSTDDFAGHDIILTSYGIMRRDIAFLKDFEFFYTILDESQKIKNPLSQTAKAARILKARHRLVLTGTPVENNTLELWSQFSFLNPGLLGSLNYFKKAFTYPIEKKQDHETAGLLRKLVYPFVLRRTKEYVAKELPPKNEQTVYCVMNPAQENLYQQWKNYYRAIILNKIETEGLDKARMNVLAGLVKLRQIACHPVLVDKTIEEDSGKFEYLKEILEEIISEDHKVLLFSQFVRMLKLVQKFLDDNGIKYVYLDGNTINRQEIVEQFQNDGEIKIFLISLKAGGTGLNLTAADYVIHYDPWWNPAVEVQATDRAHRIGQDKKVFVYRLITRNSVEEKMLELQARKQKLVSDLITTDTGFLKNLSGDNIEFLFS